MLFRSLEHVEQHVRPVEPVVVAQHRDVVAQLVERADRLEPRAERIIDVALREIPAIHEQGAEPRLMSAQQFAEVVRSEYKAWKPIVERSGAKLE